MSSLRPSRFFVALYCIAFSAAFAQAAEVTVNCNKKGATIAGALSTLDKNVANTVNIQGACKELVVIERFKDLTLVGKSNASISDPTPPETDADGNPFEEDVVVSIGPQSTVTVRSLTINGGGNGVFCRDQSSCRMEDVTIQGAFGDGVNVGFAGSVSVLGNSVLQDNGSAGLGSFGASNIEVAVLVAGGPSPTIRNNLGPGLRVWDGSFLRVVGATIQGNGGSGIDADNGSTLRIFGGTITGNGGDGVTLRASTARITGSVEFPIAYTGNAGNGINVRNLSFLRMNGTRNISGHALMPPPPLPLWDVNCASVTAATVGVLAPAGVGTTNCTEPAL